MSNSGDAKGCSWAKAATKTVLVIALLLAAVGYVLFTKYVAEEKGVMNTCYGRYEMCMELNYKGHMDRLPEASKDDFMFAREEVTRDLILSDSVQNLWYTQCFSFDDASRLRPDPAWYCQCVQELQEKCWDVDFYHNGSSATVLGNKDRENALDSSYHYMISSIILWSVSGGLVLLCILGNLLARCCRVHGTSTGESRTLLL